MAQDHSRTEIAAFAARHGLTEEHACAVLSKHGGNRSTWGETARNPIHFLQAAS